MSTTRPRAAYAVTIALSLAIFAYFINVNAWTLYGDEAGYWEIARRIGASGLTGFSDPLRTYLYPLFIAVIRLFTGEDSCATVLVAAILQYLLYAGTVLFLARTAGRLAGREPVFFWTLLLGLTNPYLIAGCTVLLTDVPAACLIAVALVLVLTIDLRDVRGAFIVTVCTAAAVMIRPAAALFLLVIGGLAAVRIVRERPPGLWKPGLAVAPALAMFYPQLASNVAAYHDYTPLVHEKLFALQTTLAVRYFKYATVVIPNQDQHLWFASPFSNPPGMTMTGLLLAHPIRFLITFGAHVFGMLNWEFLNTYVSDLRVGPMVVTASVFLYLQWFLIAVGMATVARRPETALFRWGLFIAAAAYTAFIGMTQVESRFGFPVYLVLLPFAGFGAVRVLAAVKTKRGALAFGGAFAALTVLMLVGSFFFDRQTGRITWF